MSRMRSCISKQSFLSHPRGRVRGGKRAIRHMRIALPLIAGLLGPVGLAMPAAAQPKVNIEQSFADSLTAMPKEELGASGGFYVPAYSSIAMSQGKLRVDFSVTLSVHNASETQPLVLK